MPRPRRRTPNRGVWVGVVSAVVIVVAAMLLFSNRGPRARLEADEIPAGAPSFSSSSSAPGPASDVRGQAGYLDGAAIDPRQILPPPPAVGSPRSEADRRIYLATRTLSGSPRWALAASDDDQNVPSTLHDFSCALGASLNEADAPALETLLNRVAADSRRVIEASKEAFKSQRPFLANGGDICVIKTPELAASPDYPSGHGAWGWLTALLLAEIAPDRSAQVLIRGRAYGDSRVICGVHTTSAIDGGRTLGAAMAAALHSSPEFKSDLEAARAELSNLRQIGSRPSQTACAAEAALTRASYY